MAHLLEVHAYGIIENVQPHLVFVLVGFGLFDAVHFSLVHDLDFEVAKFAIEIIQLVG